MAWAFRDHFNRAADPERMLLVKVFRKSQSAWNAVINKDCGLTMSQNGSWLRKHAQILPVAHHH